LKLDFQDAVVVTRLYFFRIDPERQRDDPRKSAVSALATLPVDVPLLCRPMRALQGQNIFLQVDCDVVPGYPASSPVTTTLFSPSQMLIGGKSRVVGQTPKTPGSFRLAFGGADEGIDAQPGKF
jgi:hypothetical protein